MSALFCAPEDDAMVEALSRAWCRSLTADPDALVPMQDQRVRVPAWRTWERQMREMLAALRPKLRERDQRVHTEVLIEASNALSRQAEACRNRARDEVRHSRPLAAQRWDLQAESFDHAVTLVEQLIPPAEEPAG